MAESQSWVDLQRDDWKLRELLEKDQDGGSAAPLLEWTGT